MVRRRQGGGDLTATAWVEMAVRGIDKVTPTVKAFDLASLGGQPLAAFEAGSHIKVEVRDRMGVRASRDYSLVERNADGTWRIAVRFDPDGDGGSRYMHESVEVGTHLRCSPPANDFPLAENAANSLLIAGGIGITPIFAMAAVLAARHQPFTLHYVARSRDDMAFSERLVALAGDRVEFHEDDGNPQNGIPLNDILSRPGAYTHLYVCGPEGLIDDTLAAARGHGWLGEFLHVERFAAPLPRADDHGIEVVLAKSQRTLHVPADRTILDMLIDDGIDPLYDCRKGTCGLCAQTVIETDGKIDHRDHFFGYGRALAGNQMCVCVSRITGGKLVLDL